MKEKTLKILILVLCITFALFGVACNTDLLTTESGACFHSWVVETTNPTCTAEGYDDKVCSKCGKEERDNVVEKIEHSWEIETTNPTCTERGYDYSLCSVCGAEKYDNFVGVIEHDWEVERIEPTCTAEGYDHKTCLSCGKEEDDNFVGVIDHDWEVERIEPTCTAEGYDHKTCLSCGKEEDENFIDANGHEFETDYTFDWVYHWFKCKNCVETTVKEEHKVGTKGECTVCGLFFKPTEGVKYSVSNGYATVTGYNGTETDIIIAKVYNGYPVTSIGGRAFYECSSLTSVAIPDSVTSIGDSAFYRCESLTSVVIGDSVTSIGAGAFHSCKSLTSVVIPDSVTSIGVGAFYRCSSLTSIVIGDSVTSVDERAFYYCDSLTSVFYKGTATDWNKISIGTYNSKLTSAKRYYYSETKPTTSGNYWHYDENGNVVIW